jgi:hypothetical protein
MGSWSFSAFRRRASGIGVLFGRGQVESQFFLDAGQCNLSYFWELASRISVQFGRRHVESSLEPKFPAPANRRLIGSPKVILVSFLSVFPFFSPMNSFFHFIQFQFKMKK